MITVDLCDVRSGTFREGFLALAHCRTCVLLQGPDTYSSLSLHTVEPDLSVKYRHKPILP